jgi:hypothetical protein
VEQEQPEEDTAVVAKLLGDRQGRVALVRTEFDPSVHDPVAVPQRAQQAFSSDMML